MSGDLKDEAASAAAVKVPTTPETAPSTRAGSDIDEPVANYAPIPVNGAVRIADLVLSLV